jgi:flagellar basal body-associated protein FliL
MGLRSLFALSAVILSLLVGLTSSGLPRNWLVFGSARASPPPAPRVSAPPSVQEEFLIPLADADANRYLRTTVVIEFKRTRDRDELRAHLPQLRDAFIAQSIDRGAEDYSGHEGLERSKAIMRAALASTRPDLEIRGIYFSDFILR